MKLFESKKWQKQIKVFPEKCAHVPSSQLTLILYTLKCMHMICDCSNMRILNEFWYHGEKDQRELYSKVGLNISVWRFLGNVHVLTKCPEYTQPDYLIDQFRGGYTKVYTTTQLGFRVLVLLDSETQSHLK
jgi:hypothetical protein